MSIPLNHNDFQCLQDQLVDLRTKNYELTEKSRRSQADFEAAKARICALQLKLEEQERDFETTSTTLRREIEAVATTAKDDSEAIKEDDYKNKYKKLLPKARELQHRYEKSLEVVKQLEEDNQNLREKLLTIEDDNKTLKNDLYTLQAASSKPSIGSTGGEEAEDLVVALEEPDAVRLERDKLNSQVTSLNVKLAKFESRLEAEAEERKIQEKKGLQIVRDLKRQLALERVQTETLQKRLERFLSQPQMVAPILDEEAVNIGEEPSQLSVSSSINDNESTKGRQKNSDENSLESWSFVQARDKANANLNQHSNNNIATNITNPPNAPGIENSSLYSINSEDRETVQQPACDNSDNSTATDDFVRIIANIGQIDGISKRNVSSSKSSSTHSGLLTRNDNNLVIQQPSPTEGILLDEQAELMDRITRLQHEKWTLEEKLSYVEQANSSLTEDLANKSQIIRNYFMDQVARQRIHHQGYQLSNTGNNGPETTGFVANLIGLGSNNDNDRNSRRVSLPGNRTIPPSDKPSLKKVVDFIRDKSHASGLTSESENINREATRKMQLMLEETLTKCLKLQENLDLVTGELNKLKS